MRGRVLAKAQCAFSRRVPPYLQGTDIVGAVAAHESRVAHGSQGLQNDLLLLWRRPRKHLRISNITLLNHMVKDIFQLSPGLNIRCTVQVKFSSQVQERRCSED